MNTDATLKRHTVRCYECGKQVTDLNRTRTEIRKQLQQEGWSVAIPFECTVPIRHITPEMNGKTVAARYVVQWKTGGRRLEVARRYLERQRVNVSLRVSAPRPRPSSERE
jgi:hypothetical protein